MPVRLKCSACFLPAVNFGGQPELPDQATRAGAPFARTRVLALISPQKFPVRISAKCPISAVKSDAYPIAAALFESQISKFPINFPVSGE
jgi:hypothetical protein